jgi:Xaa-Pro dipeptidase
MVNTRLAKLSEALQASGLDALALNAGSSLTYLTGLHFHLSERPVVAIFTTDHAPVIGNPQSERTALPDRIFPVWREPC